jgi:hypothetical protein
MPTSMKRAAIFVVIVASIVLDGPRFPKWSAELAADWWDGIDQYMQLSDSL